MPDVGAARGTILIVGGDSLIGGALAKRWLGEGRDVVVTSRRRNGPGGALRLDLARQEEFAVPPGATAAILAAGVTGFRACDHSSEAEAINTVKIPALAERLLAAGVFVVLLSSSAVFAADATRPDEDAQHRPGADYGRQKSLGEARTRECAAALGAGERLCVVRLTKALAPSAGPVADWLRAWRSGERAIAFSDVRTSPVTPDYLAQGIMAALRRSVAGDTHFSGAEGIRYADLCLALAKNLGLPDESVRAVDSGTLGRPAPFRPTDGAIGMRRTAELTGMAPQPLEDVVRALVGDICRMRTLE